MSVAGLLAAPLWGRWIDNADDPRKPLNASLLASVAIYLLISQQAAFIWLALLNVLIGFVGTSIEPMSDAITMDILKRLPKSGYGSIRLWGSLGWAVTVMFGGWIIQETSIMAAFWGYSFMAIGTWLIINVLPVEKSEQSKTSSGKNSLGTRKMLNIIKSDRTLLGLALAISILWFTRIGIFQFQAIYLDQLGAVESIIGLGFTIGPLLQLPGMLWVDRLIKRYGSKQVLGATFLLYALSTVFTIVHPSIATVIITGSIGGFAFSFYNVGLVVFLSECAPMGQVATSLTIYKSTIVGFMIVLASPLSGLIFDYAGAYWLYVFSLVGGLISALVFWFFVQDRNRNK